MKSVIILLLLLTIVCPCHSFGKNGNTLVKANYYYSHYAYNEAIPYLEKLIATGSSSLDVYVKLGDSYRLTGNMEKAAKAYAKATLVKRCSSITYLNYGVVLMKLMKYDEAEKNFRKYLEKNKKDERALSLISSCASAAAKLNDIPSGITRFAPFNSDGSDFAPTLWNGNLVFTSNTPLAKTWKEKDKWSGNAYCGIYSIPVTGPGAYGEPISTIQGPRKMTNEYHTGPCTFTADGKEMYYTASKYNGKFSARRASLTKDSAVLLRIMIASGYNERKNAFRKLKPFQYNSKEYSVAHPAISQDGSLLVFVSDMPHGAGKRDLYLCKKEGGKWATPENLGKVINTEGDEAFPWWANDTTLFFSSDGHGGLGGLDIYRTIYNAQKNAFSKPEAMPMPVNSQYDDISLAMSVDLIRGYFSSDRPATKGGDNIYYYEKRESYLQLNITDSTTQMPLEGVAIALNSTKRKLDIVSPNGRLFKRLFPETEYNVRISKEGYLPKEIAINTTSDKIMDTIVRKVSLLTPEKPHRDTVAPILTEQMVIRNRNVMDSPGIRGFNLNETYEVGDFSFGYNKYDLTNVHKKFLDTLVAQLNRHGTMRIEIYAHTDCRGSAASNLQLSIKRAIAVVNYLESNGIQKGRVSYKGLGSTMLKVKCPDCNSCTEEQHSLNRIFEFKVLHL